MDHPRRVFPPLVLVQVLLVQVEVEPLRWIPPKEPWALEEVGEVLRQYGEVEAGVIELQERLAQGRQVVLRLVEVSPVKMEELQLWLVGAQPQPWGLVVPQVPLKGQEQWAPVEEEWKALEVLVPLVVEVRHERWKDNGPIYWK